jgi:hypothetical protein
MERTGGLEPPFSAPFTYHRFEAGVGYVRMFDRAPGRRARPVGRCARGSVPLKLVENRGNAPRTACLQGEPESLLVPHDDEGWNW